LARTDLLLAREEMLAAKAALAESNSRERQALERYRFLTGSETLPTRIDEEIVSAAAENHPRRRLAEAAAERARAEMQFARESRRDSPELTIGWQQSREDSAAKDQHSLRFAIRIPFAGEARNAPRIAAANTGIIRAETEYRQVLAELDGEQREAASRLADTQLALQASELRATLAAERLHHLERAFALGELSLSDLVRVRGAANEARLEATRARLAHAAARARDECRACRGCRQARQRYRGRRPNAGTNARWTAARQGGESGLLRTHMADRKRLEVSARAEA
jgi:outer membrane protein TolC